jgi:hypothetical protein
MMLYNDLQQTVHHLTLLWFPVLLFHCFLCILQATATSDLFLLTVKHIKFAMEEVWISWVTGLFHGDSTTGHVITMLLPRWQTREQWLLSTKQQLFCSLGGKPATQTFLYSFRDAVGSSVKKLTTGLTLSMGWLGFGPKMLCWIYA